MASFKTKDMIGQKFGKLTVLSLDSIQYKRRVYKCQCDCGNTTTAMGSALRNGRKASCGCTPFSNDMVGRQFGLLTVIEFDKMKNGKQYWFCKCSCDKQTICSANRQSLIDNNTRSCGCIRRVDWTGFVNHRLTVISYSHTEGKIAYWNCKCKCGNEWTVRAKDIRKTKSCGCWKVDVNMNSPGNMSGQFMKHLKHNATRRNLEFAISEQYLWDLFLEQDGKCALTGLPIIIERQYLKNRVTHTASLDRTDNTKGYIEGNVRWTHWRANMMRNNMTDNELYEFSKEICKTYEDKNNVYQNWWKNQPEDTSYISSI